MKRRLINVRLDDDHARKARKLRDNGIVLSELVREAIDSKFAHLAAGEPLRNMKTVISLLFERHPDPPGLPPRDYDVHDRREARAAIQRKLARARR